MQCSKEIDITNDNPNEDPADQSEFSLMNKRSEIKSPKPSRTEIFPSLCLFFNQSRKKVQGIDQELLLLKLMILKKREKKHRIDGRFGAFMRTIGLSIRLKPKEK